MNQESVVIYLSGMQSPLNLDGGIHMYQYIKDVLARKKDFIEIIQKSPSGDGNQITLIPANKIMMVQLS